MINTTRHNRLSFALHCLLAAAAMPATNLTGIGAEAGPALRWHLRTSPASMQLFGVASGPDHFVAVGINTNLTIHSTDGASWALNRLPEGQRLTRISFANGRFLTMTQRPERALMESADGTEWKPIQPHDIPTVLSRLINILAWWFSLIRAMRWNSGPIQHLRIGDSIASCGGMGCRCRRTAVSTRVTWRPAGRRMIGRCRVFLNTSRNGFRKA